MQNAKAANMPKDNVERAIKRATDKDTSDYKEVLFEGYAAHGIAVLDRDRNRQQQPHSGQRAQLFQQA
jgi:transcriptional/translational regulatory protein YebC/TACO1